MTTETTTAPPPRAPDTWAARVDARLDRVETRLDRVEHGLAAVSERLARVETTLEATLPHLASKADVQAAVNGLTWRLFMGLGALGAFLAALLAALRWLGN